MYVRCGDCDWAQDDFYSPEGYNPFDFMMKNLKPDLFQSLEELHKPIHFEDDDLKGEITVQQQIGMELLKWAERILVMKWITYEQFKDDPKKTCPKCGNEHLITD